MKLVSKTPNSCRRHAALALFVPRDRSLARPVPPASLPPADCFGVIVVPRIPVSRRARPAGRRLACRLSKFFALLTAVLERDVVETGRTDPIFGTGRIPVGAKAGALGCRCFASARKPWN